MLLRASIGIFFAATIAAGAGPYYQIEDLLIGSTLSSSRDEDWKPADGLALEASALATLDWVEAGDWVCVANGVCDKVFYGEHTMATPVMLADSAAVEILGLRTPWNEFVSPQPLW